MDLNIFFYLIKINFRQSSNVITKLLIVLEVWNQVIIYALKDILEHYVNNVMYLNFNFIYLFLYKFNIKFAN